jgi:transcriptional regulator GlxA family with amidase domain
MNRRNALLGGATAVVAAATTIPAAGAVLSVKTLAAPVSGPILVGVLVGNGANVIDFAGAWEVFQDVVVPGRGTSEADESPFRIAMVSEKSEPLTATGGMIVTPRFSFDTVPALPNVLVIGAQGEHTPEKIAWIRKAAQKADVVMSVCTGAFLLAKTGLLDGLEATTHHDFYDAFAKEFPAVRLVRGPRFIDQGNVATAGGLTSGIELALHVVQRYFGTAVTNRAAHYMEYARSPQRPTV